MSFVEFRQNLEVAQKYHKQALQHIRNFWSLLTKKSSDYNILWTATRLIARSSTRADTSYQVRSVTTVASCGLQDAWAVAVLVDEPRSLTLENEWCLVQAMLNKYPKSAKIWRLYAKFHMHIGMNNIKAVHEASPLEPKAAGYACLFQCSDM